MTLVRLVKTHGALSRAELARLSGMGKPTVTTLIPDLIEEGWLYESDVLNNASHGRPSTPLCFDGGKLGLVGVEIGVDSVNVIACRLNGDLLNAQWVDRTLKENHDAKATLDLVARLVRDVTAAAKRQGVEVIGCGVGVPGVVRAKTGVLDEAPNLGWKNIPVGRHLEIGSRVASGSPRPFRVLNEANAAAMSEYMFARRGAQVAVSPLVYLSIGVGLGGGVIVDDQLYEGHRGYAGEIGHSILHPGGMKCVCGRKGCAEAHVSLRALSHYLRPHRGLLVPVERIQRRLDKGEAEALDAVSKVGADLGLLLHNLSYALDPAVIVLGGALSVLGETLLDHARQSLKALSGPPDREVPDLRLCSFGRDACAIGAAGAALHELLFPLKALA